jgi:hypothetical protein
MAMSAFFIGILSSEDDEAHMVSVFRYSLLAALLAGISSAQSVIHLKTGDIETNPDAAVAEISSPAPGVPGHLLLQFRQHPTAATVRALRRRGIRVLGDVPENGLLVAIEHRANIASLGAHYAEPIDPGNKISPLIALFVARQAAAPADLWPNYFLVEFHRDTDMNRARATLLNLGLVPIDNPDLHPHHLMLQLSSDQTAVTIAALASLDEVAYVFPASRELALGVPAPYYAAALTVNGSTPQSIPTFGDGWDGPGLGPATVSYVMNQMTVQLDFASAQSEIRRAMTEWSKVAQIAWQQAANPFGLHTVNILFATYAHGDGYPFDGPGGVLAHTFYPAPPNPEPIAGDLHLDDSENWHIGANTDLFSVALHELGLALGLGHSDDPTAVMYQYYRMVTTLAAPDKAAILTLYAAQPSTVIPPPPVPLALTVNQVASTTTGASVSLSGSASGGSSAITVAWSASTGASGIAAGSASAWTIANIPLAVGANIITVTATAAGSQLSKTLTVTRAAAGSGSGGADTTAPSLTVTSPSSGTMSTTASFVTIAGTASDNVGVTLVSWATNFGSAGAASGTTAWSAAIPLLIGNNSVTVRAYDAAGNFGWRSVVISRR